VELPEPVVTELLASLEADPSTPVVVDLLTRSVQAAGLSASFDIDDYVRWRLLEGLDDIAVTLTHADDIAAYEARRPPWMPVTA
jgi:3-isopropylmalate/(R)-2-methylmalate dehydratase small subunit